MMYRHGYSPDDYRPVIVRLSDGAQIPLDHGNPDYQAVGAWVAAGNAIASATVPLDGIKVMLRARIDKEAEAARQRYITAGDGQALEYREAQEEANRYAATGGAGQYPMLAASVAAGEAADLAAAAAIVDQRETAWQMVGAQIRKLRLAAKRAIDAAATEDQARAAAQVTWP